MTFTQSVRSCFVNYATFEGRAPRSEYWYWVLFTIFGGLFCQMIDYAVSGTDIDHIGLMNALFSLGIFFPSSAVALRRCGDADISRLWAAPNIILSFLFAISDPISYTSAGSTDLTSLLFPGFYALIFLVPFASMLVVGLKGSRKGRKQDSAGVNQW